MAKSNKRFAIKFPDGTYSNGPRGKHVPFQDAKIWLHIGHVKTHLQHDRRYPPGTKRAQEDLRRAKEILKRHGTTEAVEPGSQLKSVLNNTDLG
jgi:hypothetical protein